MAPTQNMEMKMKYALAAMYPGIDDKAISGIGNLLLFCDRITGQQQTSKQRDVRILKLGNRGHMLSWNDQRMRRRLRFDVVECNHQLVFIDERCGNGSCGNFAKETLAHEVGPFLNPDFPNRVANS